LVYAWQKAEIIRFSNQEKAIFMLTEGSCSWAIHMIVETVTEGPAHFYRFSAAQTHRASSGSGSLPLAHVRTSYATNAGSPSEKSSCRGYFAIIHHRQLPVVFYSSPDRISCENCHKNLSCAFGREDSSSIDIIAFRRDTEGRVGLEIKHHGNRKLDDHHCY
jgi:hypothetical protein